MQPSADLTCSGDLGCFYPDIVSTSAVRCDGQSSCAWGDIIAQSITCASYGACMQSTLSAAVINAWGYSSVQSATMDSTGLRSMKVNAMGHRVGYAATVLCRSGSTCTVVCSGTGCENMGYVCEDGAQCSCEGASCPDIVASESLLREREVMEVPDDIMQRLVSQVGEEKAQRAFVVVDGQSHAVETGLADSAVLLCVAGVGVGVLAVAFYAGKGKGGYEALK